MVLGVGASLRFASLGEPSLWLDEILGYDLATAAMSRPLWMWITGFEAEHGPLYYATQLAGRIVPDPESAARWVPAVFGIATIWLVWLAALRASGQLVGAVAAAAILACSPLHVYYSREGRPYALAMLLAALMLASLLRGSPLFYGAVVAALYTSAITAPLIFGAAVAAGASWFLHRSEPPPRLQLRGAGALVRFDRTAAIVAALMLIAVPLLYRGEVNRMAGIRFPELSASFFESLVRAFTVSAIGSDERGRTAAAILVLVVIGAVSLFLRDRRRALIVTAMAVLPVAIAIAALRVSDHWYAVRYVTPALPAYVVLAGTGIAAIARAVAKRLRLGLTAEWIVVVLAVIGIAAQTIPAARVEAHQKLNWRLIASTLWSHAAPGDVVVAAEGWSRASLGFYLRRLPPRVRFLEASRPEMAEGLVSRNGRAWFVTAGYSEDTRVREWICRFPVVLSSELEEFRLHYAPDAADLLRSRSTIHERRAVMAVADPDAVVLHMTPEDVIFLDESWAGAEGTGRDAFRWVVGRRATATLPLTGRAKRILKLRASPLEHDGLPPQVMQVSLNGKELGEFAMRSGDADYEVTAGSDVWRSDGANILELRFSRANAPSDLDRSLTDPRPLSAAFHEIAVHEGADPSSVPSLFRTIRLQELTATGAASYLDHHSAWRRSKTRLPNLNRSAVEKLLGRLGFDPQVAWPRLVAGEVSLEVLIESLATSSACEDEVAFIRRTWRTLFERAPNVIEERVLLSMLRSERSRLGLIRKIVRMTELRAVVSEPSPPRQRGRRWPKAG